MKDTNNDRQYAPKVLLCRLIERASANGNRYFTGYMGEARVILLADKDADPEKLYGGVAAWKLLVEEKRPKPEG
jgi:hypothetical protein